ncbi:hypothetical protein JXJ21_11110 [candidate division KSB1 bacterium]|nr:hypothetical protein [candidate division KSB1 bacterium]
MFRSSLLTMLAIGLMLMFAVNGCIFDSPEDAVDDPKEEPETSQLDLEFGGYNTADEAAAFGDESLATEFGEDEAVSDLIESDPAVEADLNADSIDVYFLRIKWGRLQWDSTASSPTDWSGSAVVNKGTLVILRKIRFEGADKLLPRPDRKTVEWESVTQPHFDGLALAIINNDTTDIAGEFTLTAGAYSRTFTFDELDSLDLLEPVGNEGDEISIQSRKKSLIPFAGGFLEGRWIRTDSTGGGFKGRWINSIGTHAGYLKGIWGINKAGHKVMFGKWITLSGRFNGLLAGTWNKGADEHQGNFEGYWVERNLRHAGDFKGQWKTGDAGTRAGQFQGRWRKVK